MYQYLLIISALLAIQTIGISSTLAADGDPCTVILREKFLNGITEEHKELADGSFVASVPNYAQQSFFSSGGCGVNSAMMLIGYWDANGWPCLVRNSPPFYQTYYYKDNAGNMQSEDKYPVFLQSIKDKLVENVNFLDNSGATGSLNYHDEVIETIKELNTDTNDWSGDNQRDEYSQPGWIIGEIDAERPLIYYIKSEDASMVWVDDSGHSSQSLVDWHVVPIIGYKEIQDGIEVAGSCVGYGSTSFKWAVRSSWRNGGDSYVWISNYDTGRVVSKFVPGGRSTCRDYMDQDEDGYLARVNESWLQGLTSSSDCDDSDPLTFPGAIETCGTEDRDCDGNAENGIPDLDGDMIMNICDDDIDGDSVNNAYDDCGVSGVDCSEDFDNDQLADYFDNCRRDFNPNQGDCDHDGVGNACDSDTPEPCVELMSIRDNAANDRNLDHKHFTVTYKTWGFVDYEVDHIRANWCGGCSTVNDDPTDVYFHATTENCLEALCLPNMWDRVNWGNCTGTEATDWSDFQRCPSIPFDGDDGVVKTFYWTQGTNLADQYMYLNDVRSPELFSGVQVFFRLKLRPQGHSTAALQNVSLQGPPDLDDRRMRSMFNMLQQTQQDRFEMTPSFLNEMNERFGVPLPFPEPYGER